MHTLELSFKPSTVKLLFKIWTFSAFKTVIPDPAPLKLNPSTVTLSDSTDMTILFKVALSLNNAIGLVM